MQDSDIPVKFQVPFASSAPGGNIRAVPVSTVDPNAASETLGFPTPTLTPISGGGVPPDGRDFNGLFNQITAWVRWLQAGGPITYDSMWQAQVGGYPKNAVVMSALYPATQYISTADSNLNNPDTGGVGGGTGWSYFGAAPGSARLTYRTDAQYGWILAGDGITIGNATSNSTLASATAWPLFNVVWNNVSNTYAPLFTSDGTPVARGVNAASDFAASGRLELTLQYGRALVIAGAGAGLSSRPLGSTFGAETVGLTAGNNGPHFHAAAIFDPGHLHTISDPGHIHNIQPFINNSGNNLASGGGAAVPLLGNSTLASATMTINTSISTTGITDLAATTAVRVNSGNGLDTTATSGSGTPHANVQPSTAWNLEIKL